MRALRVALLAATAGLLGMPAGADSDEYSAFAFIEASVVGIQVESTITLHSPVENSSVLLVAGLAPAGINLGATLPVLRVGPPYFTFQGGVTNGIYQMSFRFGPSFPAGTPIYVQGLIVTPTKLLVNGSNTLQLFPNHTETTWSNGTPTLPPRTSAFGGGDVDWADVDKNGYLDAWIANAGDGALPSLLMNGLGGLADEASARLPLAAQATAVCVEMADVDHDGYGDAFLGMGPDTFAAANLLLRNDGTAHFTIDNGFPGGGGLAVDAEFGDIDGDEDLDLMVVSAIDPNHVFDTPDPTTLYRQGRNGEFVADFPFSAIPTNESLDVDGDVSLGDVDRDGDLDVFVANSGTLGAGGQNRLFINNGAGTFVDETLDALPLVDDSSHEADFIDIDQDGDLDIFVANSLSGDTGINMLINVGPFPPASTLFVDGELVFISSFPPSTEIRLACDVADVEGDGDLDIGVAVHHLFGPGGAEGEAFLLLNQGGVQGGLTGLYGVDANFDQFGLAMIAGDLSFADVDNDGDQDCYVTSNGDLLGQEPPQDVLIINEL